MTDWQIFPNAPIVEAIIDIRTVLPSDTDTTKLAQFGEILKDHYKHREEQKYLKSNVRLHEKNKEPEIRTESGIKGFLFRSEEQQKVLQVQIDGFSFSKLKPYETWDLFFEEGKELWNHYVEIANPSKVVRIALRYINRIVVPADFSDFNEYLLTNPKIAENLPQSVANFFMRLTMVRPEIEAIAILTQTMEDLTGNKLPLILDIDVVKKKEFKADDEIWKDFLELREFKNEIFFNSITDKTKELFK